MGCGPALKPNCGLEARVGDWAMRKFLVSESGARCGDGRLALDRQSARAHWGVAGLVKDPLEAGDRFDGPTIFILGGKSRFVEAGDHATIREHFPAATIRIIPDSGHNPHFEAREAFVRAVLAEA
jgi:esterase